MIGKPSDDDIIAIREILTLLLLDIPYNKEMDRERPHTMWGIIATKDDYRTVHGLKFVLLPAIKSYDPSMTKETVEAKRLQKTTRSASSLPIRASPNSCATLYKRSIAPPVAPPVAARCKSSVASRPSQKNPLVAISRLLHQAARRKPKPLVVPSRFHDTRVNHPRLLRRPVGVHSHDWEAVRR